MENLQLGNIVHTYKYVCQTSEKQFFVSFLTAVDEGHKKFMDSLRESKKYISVVRVYVSSIDPYRKDVEPVIELSTTLVENNENKEVTE